MIKVSIIGTGQIGKDLLCKLSRINNVKIIAFVGRRKILQSELPPIILNHEIILSEESIQYFISNPNSCDVVFDCTDAYSAVINSKIFKKQRITVIDLTPSNLGEMYIPNITPVNKKCINMVTCGAQSTLPVLNYLNHKLKCIKYIEIVTQISTGSAGMATRINIDKYIETTEDAITSITGISNNKVILNLNPSHEAIMKSTIYIITPNDDDFSDFDDFVNKVKTYIPNYTINKPLKVSLDLLTIHISIMGTGDYISEKYGNLDVINCSAIHALTQLSQKSI